MSFELSLSVQETYVVRMESILCEIALTNRGDEAVELPLLEFNNSALTLELRDSAQELVGAYSWSSFQRRLHGRVKEPHFAELALLQPGATDTCELDLLLLREPVSPGKYTLRARLQWDALDVFSSEVELTVAPSRPRQLVVGHDGDASGATHLALAWVDTIQSDQWLMQSFTFGPDHRVMDHCRRVMRLETAPRPGCLGLARGTGPCADDTTAVVLIGERQLLWCTVGASGPSPVHELQLEGTSCRLVCSPLRHETSTYVLLEGNGHAGVSALILDDDGSSTQPELRDLATAEIHDLVRTSDGQIVALSASSDASGSSVRSTPLDRSSGTKEVFRARTRLLSMHSIHGPSAQVQLAVIVEDDNPEYHLSWILTDLDSASQSAGPRFEVTVGVKSEYALDTAKAIHTVQRGEDGSCRYVSPEGKSRDLEVGADRSETLQMVGGFNGRMFLAHCDPNRGVQLLPLWTPEVG